jgi:hypothetical protein
MTYLEKFEAGKNPRAKHKDTERAYGLSTGNRSQGFGTIKS